MSTNQIVNEFSDIDFESYEALLNKLPFIKLDRES